MILAACVHPTPIVATRTPAPVTAMTDTLCALPRLTFDRLHDTLPTIAGIKDQDARRNAVCGIGK